MKLLVLFSTLFIISCNCLICQPDSSINKLSPVFAYFIDQPGCASCNYLPININLNEITKEFPNSRILVFIKIIDSSFIDSEISSKVKSKEIHYFIDDSSNDITLYFNVKELPAIIILNFNGNEIARYEGKGLKTFSAKKVKNYFKTKTINNTKKVKYPIGVPSDESIILKDSIIYYTDMLKNIIGEFNIFTGDKSIILIATANY